VTDVRLEDGARVVTFGNGLVARELVVDIDDEARNAWAQVFSDSADRSRFVWIADLLPTKDRWRLR